MQPPEIVARAKAEPHLRPVYVVDHDDAAAMLDALAKPEVLVVLAGTLRTHTVDVDPKSSTVRCGCSRTAGGDNLAEAYEEYYAHAAAELVAALRSDETSATGHRPAAVLPHAPRTAGSTQGPAAEGGRA